MFQMQFKWVELFSKLSATFLHKAAESLIYWTFKKKYVNMFTLQSKLLKDI